MDSGGSVTRPGHTSMTDGGVGVRVISVEVQLLVRAGQRACGPTEEPKASWTVLPAADPSSDGKNEAGRAGRSALVGGRDSSVGHHRRSCRSVARLGGSRRPGVRSRRGWCSRRRLRLHRRGGGRPGRTRSRLPCRPGGLTPPRQGTPCQASEERRAGSRVGESGTEHHRMCLLCREAYQ